jgi:SPP1 family predicted phage head-tail adaptor
MIVGERKGMRLADMRHRVTLMRPVKTIDASRQQITTWQPELSSQPAKYVQTSGGEIVRGRQVEASTVAVFTVNYSAAYEPEKVIVFQGQQFGIVKVDAIDGVKRFQDLQCKAVING